MVYRVACFFPPPLATFTLPLLAAKAQILVLPKSNVSTPSDLHRQLSVGGQNPFLKPSFMLESHSNQFSHGEFSCPHPYIRLPLICKRTSNHLQEPASDPKTQ